MVVGGRVVVVARVVVAGLVVAGLVVVGRVVVAGGTAVGTTVDRSGVSVSGAVVCWMSDGALVVATVRRAAVVLAASEVVGAGAEGDVADGSTGGEVCAVVVAGGNDDPVGSAGDPSAAGTTDCDRAVGEASCELFTDGDGSSPLVRAAAVTTVPAAHTATIAASAPPRCRDLLTLVIRFEEVSLCRGRLETTGATAPTSTSAESRSTAANRSVSTSGGAGVGRRPTVRAIPAAPCAASSSGCSGT